jgi:hypothetical protein
MAYFALVSSVPVNFYTATGAAAAAAAAGCSFLAAGTTSPLQIQHLIPSFPYNVFASANPYSMFARKVCNGTRP